MAIKFYFDNDATGVLANSSAHPIRFLGATWPTAEHLFHALKFHTRPDLQEQIRGCSTAQDVKRLSTTLAIHVPPHWSAVRVSVMSIILWEKFTQNADAQRILVSTGSEELIEQIPEDYPWDNKPNTFWGRTNDGTGENRLGEILMAIRNSLQTV